MKTTERISHSSKVMVIWWFVLIPLSAATLCPPGQQYWKESLEKCMNCSKCPEVGHVVLRPCEVHQDTVCGPISALNIDWSFLGRPHASKPSRGPSHHHHHHHHSSEERRNGDAKHHLDIHMDSHSLHSGLESEDELEHFLDHKDHHSHPKTKSSERTDRKGHKKSHRKKWSSSEEVSSTHIVDDTPNKHHKHQHHHKNHSKSETHPTSPRKHHSHNHNKTRNHHHRKFKWSSSETIDSFEFPDAINSSETHRGNGHRWSFSETSSSAEHHDVSSVFIKSNSTKKHSHHHSHHSHPHMKNTNTTETHKHHGKKHKNLQKESSEIKVNFPESASQLKESEKTIVDSSGKGVEKGHEHPSIRPEQSPISQKHSNKVVTPSVSSAPFSRAEEIIWDWQATALALAVFACLLFFLVACVYSVHHARQWRRLKNNFEDFEADVGELSTRLSLLLPTLHPEEGSSVPADCCTDSSQCVYLEKLLARKRQVEEGEHGNVYIDRDVTNNTRG